MSFKVPKYTDFLDPRHVPDGLRKWFVVDKISDEDFRTAMTEAYWLMSLAIDQATAARMRRQSRVGVVGATSRAEIKASELVQRRRDEILWLLAGLMGLHLPAECEAAQKKALELCRVARERAQKAQEVGIQSCFQPSKRDRQRVERVVRKVLKKTKLR